MLIIIIIKHMLEFEFNRIFDLSNDNQSSMMMMVDDDSSTLIHHM